MPTFAYRATTLEGRTLRGVEEAVSPVALERTLAGRGLYALDVIPARERTEESGFSRGRLIPRGADVTEAMATLASLLEVGLPLERALEITIRGAARRDVAGALASARQRVREGGKLADALAEYPALFPAVAVGLVRAADRGGHLAEAVRRLAEHLERERALRARLVSALTYPLLLVGTGALSLAVLLLFVLPRFVTILDDAEAALPRSTALLLATSTLLGRIWPLLMLGVLIAPVVWIRWRATERGRERTDALLLRLPLVGPLRARYASARLARTLGTLLSGGLPLVPALEIAGDASGDMAVGAQVRTTREEVRRGEALSAALRRRQTFPFIFVRLVEVGEETGQLEVMLERVAALLDAELERRLDRLVSLIEPTLILLFGVLVGFVALSLLQAIYGVHADAF